MKKLKKMNEDKEMPVRIPKLFTQIELKHLKFNMIQRGMSERKANVEIQKLIETNWKNHLKAKRAARLAKKVEMSKEAKFIQPGGSKPL